MSDSKDREVQFLKARAQRQTDHAASSSQFHNKERREALEKFWSSFREEIRQWQDRLQALLTDQESKQSLTERRTKLRIAMADLQASLEALRNHCLTMDSIDTKKHKNLDWEVPSNIPAGDLRLLHTELTTCFTQLEQAKGKLLPKAKFVFRLYRQAMQEQQQREEETKQGTHDDLPQETVEKFVHSDNVKPAEKSDNPLENKSDLSICVAQNGEVNMKPIDDNSDAETDHISSALTGHVVTSPVIRDVHHCDIVLGQTDIQQLHILDVSNCTIRAQEGRIAGAIHMTNCQDVNLYLHAFHQLRIHASFSLDIHIQNVEASGATILEDCSTLVFYVAGPLERGENKGLDVKDFNWLRNGVPSPNFTVEVEDHREAKNGWFDPKNVIEGNQEDPPQPAAQSVLTEVETLSALDQVQLESDDEDEL